MGILQRLTAARDAFFQPRADNSITTSKGLAEEIWREASAAAAGEAVSASTAEKLTAVGRCVRLLSLAVASMPLALYERTGPDRATKKPALDDPLYTLLHDRPNEWQTSFQWRSLMQRDLELRGNAISLISRGVGRRVTELIRLHPDQVEIRQDDAMRVTYRYARENGRRIDLDQDEVLHVWFESDNGIRGLSPISMHRESLGDSLAIQQHGSRFFRNGAKPNGVIEFDGPMSDESLQTFRDDWQKTYAGGENAWKTLLLPFGLSFKPVTISNEDSQYIEQRKFNISEVARIFGVPPHKIGDLEKATFSNIEHQAIEFVQDAIVPRVTGWEQSVRRDLLDADPNRFVKFGVDVLLRGDAKTRAEALEIQRRNGIINANEWRDLEDMNRRDDPGGAEYIVEANMRPQDGSPPPPAGNEG